MLPRFLFGARLVETPVCLLILIGVPCPLVCRRGSSVFATSLFIGETAQYLQPACSTGRSSLLLEPPTPKSAMSDQLASHAVDTTWFVTQC